MMKKGDSTVTAGTSTSSGEHGIVAQLEKVNLRPIKEPNQKKYKLAQLCIQDMLDAEQVDSGQFFSEGLRFHKVYLCAKIVSIKDLKDSCVITVSDGTAQIPCMYYQDNMEKLMHEAFHMPSDLKRNDITIATGMMLQSMRFLQKTIPKFEDLECGNVLKIIGQLKSYNNQRVVVIRKVINESNPDSLEDHKEYLSQFRSLRAIYDL